MHVKARILTAIMLATVLAMAAIVAACGGDDDSATPATAVPAPAPTMAPSMPAAPEATPTPAPGPTQAPAASVDVGHEVGQMGADFTLTSVDGEEINLYSLRGSPVVLYYFATW